MKRGRYQTNIEREMRKALTKANIDFVQEYPIRCRYGYILDFCILPRELNLAVECDGEHWHRIGNRHDRVRDIYLKKLGWKVLRFRGKEIQKDIHTCIARIKKEIKGGKKNEN